ncbi:DUF5698 domain-containing protein [Brevibacillus sp. SYP-B805]|uniref:DUF2179 domain-containing protein n=1 Tax=Brevibacillus sp. SYP-B805 TaxID=1578199 RepID=UPI0019D1FF72|nr:DUF5698 domain-containing protein [Brevibacillus sp. SYP-B805]
MVYVAMGLIQILYVALNSFRLVLMIKGKKLLASCISTVEIFVYITGLALVLHHLETPLGVVVYSASYGIGILIGVYIEQKIALGYITLQVITENEFEMASSLREKGYGVTTWMGNGAAGHRMVHLILAKRKEYHHLQSIIQEIDPKAFIISYEPMRFVGGFWTKKLGAG